MDPNCRTCNIKSTEVQVGELTCCKKDDGAGEGIRWHCKDKKGVTKSVFIDKKYNECNGLLKGMIAAEDLPGSLTLGASSLKKSLKK